MSDNKYFYLIRKFDSSAKTHFFEKDEEIELNHIPIDSEHLVFDENNKLIGVCLFLNTYSVLPSIVLFCCKKFNVSECSLTSVTRIDNVVLCHYSLR
jgi:hypothetical protein